MKWRLYRQYFDGPDIYYLTAGTKKIRVEVDANGVFDFDGQEIASLHPFAAIVGGNRDNPYDVLAGK